MPANQPSTSGQSQIFVASSTRPGGASGSPGSIFAYAASPPPDSSRRGNENHGRAQERSIPPGDHHTAANEGNELGGPEPADERVSPRDSHGHQQKAAGQPPPQAPPALPRQQSPPADGRRHAGASTPDNGSNAIPRTSSPTPTSLRAQRRPGRPARPSAHHEDPPHMHARLEKYARTFADRLIEALKTGVALWQKPWNPGELCWPANATTGRRYRGNNAVLLLATRPDPRIRRHALGRLRPDPPRRRHGPARARRARRSSSGASAPGRAASGAEDTDDEEDRPRFLRHRPQRLQRGPGRRPRPRRPGGRGPALRAARPRSAGSPATRTSASSTCAGTGACYSSGADAITMPEPAQFTVPSAYEHTLLHELAHCTSHPSRLDRPCHGATDRGTAEYALEGAAGGDRPR